MRKANYFKNINELEKRILRLLDKISWRKMFSIEFFKEDIHLCLSKDFSHLIELIKDDIECNHDVERFIKNCHNKIQFLSTSIKNKINTLDLGIDVNDDEQTECFILFMKSLKPFFNFYDWFYSQEMGANYLTTKEIEIALKRTQDTENPLYGKYTQELKSILVKDEMEGLEELQKPKPKKRTKVEPFNFSKEIKKQYLKPFNQRILDSSKGNPRLIASIFFAYVNIGAFDTFEYSQSHNSKINTSFKVSQASLGTKLQRGFKSFYSIKVLSQSFNGNIVGYIQQYADYINPEIEKGPENKFISHLKEEIDICKALNIAEI